MPSHEPHMQVHPPDWYPDGTPFAIGEHDGASLWPREFYPSADDALEAQALHNGAWSYFDGATADVRVRLAWVLPDLFGGREPGWWTWGYRENLMAIECWEVTGV